MECPAVPYPDDQSLAFGLAIACGWAAADLAVTARVPNAGQSTFASEVVDCRVDGRTLRVFCKYSAERPDHLLGGHRRGVAFEAEVYRRVLSHLPLSTARFYGFHTDPVGGGGTWLILEFLQNAVPASLSRPAGHAVTRAAAWAGSFHAASAERATDVADLLPPYDAGYYCQWPSRAAAFVASAAEGDVAAWFGAVRRCFERDAVPRLLDGPQTVIHGEYYPNNVLVTPRASEVCPVDWESAAIGPGEIDLAALTDRWPEEFLANCVAAYTCARWPGERGAAPREFQSRLDAARLYLQFRWLGNRSTWRSARKVKRRLHDLRQLALRLGMIA